MRKSWSREFLDEVINTYLSDFDPVQRCIDYQLSSVSGSYGVKLSSLGMTRKEYVSSVEDRLIDAIDKKYMWAGSPEGVMWALYVNGFSYKEIAEIFGCAISKVWEMVMNFQKRVTF